MRRSTGSANSVRRPVTDGIEPGDPRFGTESGTPRIKEGVTPAQIAEACGLKAEVAV